MSQISDAKLDFYSGSVIHALAQDRLFIADHLTLSLANGATYDFGMVVGDKPAAFYEVEIATRSSSQVAIVLKEGGAYSGGVDMEFFSANRVLNANLPPFSDFKSAVTEDTIGAPIRNRTLLGSTDKKETAREAEGFRMILRPLTVYVLSITNQDPTDAMDFDMKLAVGVQH